jgi:hypothetical protein
VLERFRDEGKIVAIPGRGTFVPPEQPARHIDTPPEKLTTEQDIVNELCSQMHRGVLKKGEALPAVKLLCLQFKVGTKTVLRAYRQLLQQNKVTRVGRKYWVGGFDECLKTGGRKEIVVAKDPQYQYAGLFKEYSLARSFRKMERELVRYGYCLIYDCGEDFAAKLRGWIDKRNYPHGLVLFATSEKYFDTLRPHLQRLHSVAGNQGPKVLVAGPYSPSYLRHMHILCEGNVFTNLCRAMASFICDKGIDTIYLFYDTTIRAYRRLYSYFKFRAELFFLRDDITYRTVARIPPQHAASPDSAWAYLYSVCPEKRIAKNIGKYGPASLEAVKSEIVLTDDFRKVFPGSASGVWVFAQDKHALDALSWARERRVDIPRPLSIVGMENDPDFYQHGITSCEYDHDTLGYLMAHALIGDVPYEKTHRGFIKPAALMLERRTTG